MLHTHCLMHAHPPPRWIPSSARLIVTGVQPNTQGVLQVAACITITLRTTYLLVQVLQLGQDGLSSVAHACAPVGIRCGTMAASPLFERHLATGSLDGALQMWDSETLTSILSTKSAHDGAINTIHGCGGAGAEVCYSHTYTTSITVAINLCTAIFASP